MQIQCTVMQCYAYSHAGWCTVMQKCLQCCSQINNCWITFLSMHIIIFCPKLWEKNKKLKKKWKKKISLSQPQNSKGLAGMHQTHLWFLLEVLHCPKMLMLVKAMLRIFWWGPDSNTKNIRIAFYLDKGVFHDSFLPQCLMCRPVMQKNVYSHAHKVYSHAALHTVM